MANCLFDLASLKVNMNSRMILFAFRARYCKEFFLCSVSSNVITCFASEMAFLFCIFQTFVIETAFHNLINQWTFSLTVIHHIMDVKWVIEHTIGVNLNFPHDLIKIQGATNRYITLHLVLHFLY